MGNQPPETRRELYVKERALRSHRARDSYSDDSDGDDDGGDLESEYESDAFFESADNSAAAGGGDGDDIRRLKRRPSARSKARLRADIKVDAARENGRPRTAAQSRRARKARASAAADEMPTAKTAAHDINKELHYLRKALYEESPDYLYLREVDRIVDGLISHYNIVMGYTSDLTQLRKTHKMQFVGRMIDKIEPQLADIDLNAFGGGGGGDKKRAAVASTSARFDDTISVSNVVSMCCHLSSTLIAIDQSVVMVRKMNDDDDSMRKYGRHRRFKTAPSFIDTMFRLRDAFMVGCIGDFVSRKQYSYASAVDHVFSTALCDETYRSAAQNIDAKNCGKRKRMNGNEYMYACVARHAHERFDEIREHIDDDDKKPHPLFSVVVPTRVLNARTRKRIRRSAGLADDGEDDSDESSTVADMVFTASDRFECRRMLIMHYSKSDDESPPETSQHALLPVDDALFVMLARSGEPDRLTNARVAELISENARCVAGLLHTACVCSQTLARNYLRYVAPSVHEHRVGEDVLTRSVGGSERVHKVLGLDAQGAYPAGKAHARAEMTVQVAASVALAELFAGTTLEHKCSGATVALRSNALYESVGVRDQGPSLYEAASLAMACTETSDGESSLERIVMLLYCSTLSPMQNLFVLSHRVALNPSTKYLQRALESSGGGGDPRAATIPYALHMAHAWYPSLTAFIVANLRFVPTFDVTLWAKTEGSMNFACADVRVDFFSSSALFTYDNVSYTDDGRHLVIKFDLSIDNIRRNICDMSPVSRHRNVHKIHADTTEVYFPVHWRNPDVKDFASSALDYAYGGKRVANVDIRMARVYSYVQSHSCPSYCVLVGTETAEKLPIFSPTIARKGARGGRGKRRREENAYRRESDARAHSKLKGCRVATEYAPANNASSAGWRDSERYRVVNSVLNGTGESVHDVKEVAMCSDSDVTLSASARDTFIDRHTHVECANTIAIEMRILNVDARTLTHNFMSLFGFWSGNSTERIRCLHMPRFDEYTLHQYAQALQAQQRNRK